jgi:hypothetical protein
VTFAEEVRDERGLPHPGSGGEDDEVGPLQPGGELVEVVEAGGQPGDRRVVLVQLLDQFEGLGQQVLHRANSPHASTLLATWYMSASALSIASSAPSSAS